MAPKNYIFVAKSSGMLLGRLPLKIMNIKTLTLYITKSTLDMSLPTLDTSTKSGLHWDDQKAAAVA